MTNPYYDQARASEYRGGFAICPRCVSVVPAAYRDRHDVECEARHAATLEPEHAALVVEDVTTWDEQDPTA